jgi:F420-non-reducing hydrogenase small subunit
MNDIDLFGSVFHKGDVIFEQDTAGDTMFIIQSGAVEISCLRDGEKIVITLMEQGEFFGEMALIDNRPRSATATALSRTRILPVHRNSFFGRTKNDTSIILNLIKSLCQRIERTNRLLRSLMMSDDSLRAALDSPVLLSGPQPVQPGAENSPSAPGKDKTPSMNGLLHPRLPKDFSWNSQRSIVSYRKGETIFKEGDDGKEMFILVDGDVAIYTETGGHKIILNRLEAGDFFGEMALVTGHARTATAVAANDTHLITLDNAQLETSLSSSPEMALFIVQVLITRLRVSTVALESPEQSLEIASRIITPIFKKKEKVRIALISLSTCGGCTATIIQNRADLAVLTDTADVVYCPMLMDADTIGEVDIALVDGAVRTREDEQQLLEVRSKARFLAAWGTCAAFGGIPAMANQYELEELLDESYGQTIDPFSYYLSTKQKQGNNVQTVKSSNLLRKARKLDDVVWVDYFLPGCPPQLFLVTALIEELKGKKGSANIKAIVCAECPRKPKNTKPADMVAFPNGAVKEDICLVSQGVMCLGLITKGGCGAACLQGGLPCWGCRGPMQKAVGKMSNGSFYEDLMIDAMARRSKLGVDKLRHVIRLLRQKGGSSLNFDTSFIKDASRLR